MGPEWEVTDSLTPGQGVAGAFLLEAPRAGVHLCVERSHSQVGWRLEVVLGGDVYVVRAHPFHHGRTIAGSNQPGDIGGALRTVRSEWVNRMTGDITTHRLTYGVTGAVEDVTSLRVAGTEDVPTRRDVLITDC